MDNKKLFIQLTLVNTNTKVLISLNDIKSIGASDEGYTFIETGKDAKGYPIGMVVVENYDLLLKKLVDYVL